MEAAPQSATCHQRVIAIDGPAAAGKSTVARELADRLGALLFDTGALYRTVALAALRAGVSADDSKALAEIAGESTVAIHGASQRDGRLYDIWLGEEDVTWAVRSPEVGAIVSQVSEHPEVRAALLPVQRRIAGNGPVVMVGRDIGTVVVPDAGLKIYLDANSRERAHRRHLETLARGGDETFQEVLMQTLRRDTVDSGRDVAPLRQASDAIRIDTADQTIESVVKTVESLARAQRMPCGKPVWPP
ncbi:MAG: (d)CMP kinase [Chloroflexota bacterium]|nr:(d)CMP kinase [Chloroflexota bacterium]